MTTTIEAATPLLSPSSPMLARAQESVDSLKARAESDPANWYLRRELAEAMLEAGDRAGGIKELEAAMSGAERAGNLDLASALAEEIARLEPEACDISRNASNTRFARTTAFG